MPDPVSAASGILTLVVFTFQSSKFLYETVSSFQSNQRTVRELRQELEALNDVLESLRQTAETTDIDFASLGLPLRHCGRACEDFKGVIDKCTEHSSGSRTSFRDWAKLRYMGADITGFTNMLAGYKSTIIIALGDANLRTSAITANFLKEFKHIIANTTSDLNEHLQAIDTKLHAFSPQGSNISDEDAMERRRIQEERQSAEQCLSICTAVSAHIEQVQSSSAVEPVTTPRDSSQASSNTPRSSSSARLLTTGSLQVCRETMDSSTAWLRRHLQDLDNKVAALQVWPPQTSSQRSAEQEKIQEEIASTKQCLAICAVASERAQQERINVFEDVSMADDGHQVIVSTLGDLVVARRVTAGARSMQLMGQMSDDSLQQLSQNISHASIEKGKEPDVSTVFKDRYGEGWKLSPGNS